MAYLTTQSGQPVLILKEGTARTRGREARRNNIMAARIIGEAIKTTLGPRGMDKMLIDSLGDITITNDGAAILDEVEVEHPAAKMMVEVAKTQDDMVGDGTTTAVVLAGELLRKAEAGYASWNRKLVELESELEEIKVVARRRAEEEREELLAEARAAAERIKRDAVAAVDQELRRAQAKLHGEASALAVEVAAGILRDQVRPADRDRLLDEFITHVERIPVQDGSGR